MATERTLLHLQSSMPFSHNAAAYVKFSNLLQSVTKITQDSFNLYFLFFFLGNLYFLFIYYVRDKTWLQMILHRVPQCSNTNSKNWSQLLTYLWDSLQ